MLKKSRDSYFHRELIVKRPMSTVDAEGTIISIIRRQWRGRGNIAPAIIPLQYRQSFVLSVSEIISTADNGRASGN